jgi:hypothetical protein
MARTIHTPICTSLTSGTMEQCSRFILAREHGEYTEQDIAQTIVPTYFAVCATVNMDPVMLIAQMGHETGWLSSWWSQRPRRNPAGIGVNGRTQTTGFVGEEPISPGPEWAYWETGVWRMGVSFASWKDDAIPAHVGRILAYAKTDAQANAAQRALIAKALSYRSLPAYYRGCASTWAGLNGRWAVPGTTYAQKLCELANAIAR